VREKPCGLVVDFVGILGKLKKALAFDSQEVSGVVENLDVLFADSSSACRPGQAYLAPPPARWMPRPSSARGRFRTKRNARRFTSFQGA